MSSEPTMMNMDTNLSSEIHERLNDLFSWNPPQLMPRTPPGKKPAKKNLPPAYFDKHFGAKLQLLHVKRLPTLVRDITAVVDKIITNGVESHPSHELFSANFIKSIVCGVEWQAVDEKEVSSFYERTTATFCIKAASFLTLRAPNLLRYNQSANVVGYAIADSFLYFANPINSPEAYRQLEIDMGNETVELIRALARDRSSLVTEEFKSLAAGRSEVMHAILMLLDMPKFNWAICIAPDCSTSQKHQRECKKVTQAENAMGHDAKTPLWSLEDPVRDMQVLPQNLRSGKRKRDDDGDMYSRTAIHAQQPNSSRPELLFAPDNLPLLAPEGPHRSSRLLEQESVLTNVTTPPPPLGGIQGETGFPGEPGGLKGKGKVMAKGKTTVQGGDGDDYDCDDDDDDDGDDDDGDGDYEGDPSYNDKADLSARHIVQQAWAQATRVDCSILVMQAGNYEIIGIRHRLTQTLYISDLIEPHTEPSYGKIHTGIFVAAVEDAIDRVKQRSTGIGGGSNGSGPGGNPSSSRGDHKDDEGDEGPKKGGGGTMMADEMVTQRTLDLASCRDVVLLYLQYGVYDSPAPSTFVRCGPNGQAIVPLPSQETVRNYQLEDCLSIVLKSEIEHGATGTVLRGTLDVGLLADVSLDVVVKLALGSERVGALRNEYKIYDLLRKFGATAGITSPLGLFDDVEGEACALLMPYRGTPLAARSGFRLTPSHQEAILATLKNIHAAGILHGDLRLENILVADSGHTIIDFGQSQVCYDQEAKKHEYSQLRSLLAHRGKQKGRPNGKMSRVT